MKKFGSRIRTGTRRTSGVPLGNPGADEDQGETGEEDTTGTADAEQAFLALIDAADAADGSGGGAAA